MAPGDADEPLIRARALQKRYIAASGEVWALRGVDFEVARGEFVAIVGRSGCGKSTLLNLLGGLDTPSGGELRVAGRELSGLDERALTLYRRQGVGIVFQFFNLLPLLSARENTALPALLAKRGEHAARAASLLEKVGLGHRLDALSSTLSGGEMQRVALARALINDPPLLLADEPTGNLDSEAARGVLETLAALAREGDKTVVMVTHSPEAAAVADRIARMSDGRFV